MADIIRAATPITNKNIVQPMREHKNADLSPFDIQDPTRVAKPIPDSEILKQNSGNVEQQSAPEILLDLLKDPSVTVNFIKNILMLKEIVGVISMQNKPVTEEIEQLFSQLAVKPEELTGELISQEKSSTAFKGELFDFLRNMIKENPSPEMKTAVTNLLKAVNTENCRPEILKALSGTMSYLSETLFPNKELSAKLMNLSQRFKAPEAEKEFPQLKHETAQVIQEIEKSIMFSGKLSSLCSMVTYNLSRYNTNTEFLGDAAREVMAFIPDDNRRTEFLQKLYDCLSSFERPTADSKVLNVLVKILEKQTDNESVMQLKGDSVESVIHSLLSSPSNFTPLLHFIIPVDDGTNMAFGEMWINPDEEDPKTKNNKNNSDHEQNQRTIHMLLVFDIPDVGRFETELFVRDKKIDLSLMCPASVESHMENIGSDLKKSISFSEYSFNEIKVGKLEKTRSLVEVFPTLPRKRTGINVRI
ncbi:hypothetical protein [Porcipelethomonas sp.]|uniref:hypothetical protein n=1 Tax=Porcipelethomonas sp. TaxID=2981675 RepID=UPI003EF94D45